MGRMWDARQGFTLIELLVVVGTIGVLVGIVMPSLKEANRMGRLTRCESQMRQLGIASAAYAGDHFEKIASFSWRPTDRLSEWADLNMHGGSYNQAAANQAVDIIRRRVDHPGFPRIHSWIPHPLYSSLVLVDYAGWELPERIVACPEDAVRRCWQENPRSPVQACEYPSVGTPRWPFSSSYRITASSYSFDMRVITSGGEALYTVTQSASQSTYYIGQLPLGTRKMGSVQFPSQKVHMFDGEQRHFGDRNVFYAYLTARQPLLFFDGSVTVRRTSDGNRGFRPNLPDFEMPQWFYYDPDPAYECPTESGGRDVVQGQYQWTRGGLGGVDFGGGEAGPGAR